MSFSADITRFINKAEGNTQIVVKKITLELFSKVILKSPVDTGRFRGNWYASINYASNNVSDSVDKSGVATISKANSSIGSFKLSDNSIYLTNSLPYAYRLEMGWSKQAPAGIARISVMEIASKYS